jgi:DNA polymerase III epsilon subunit-like protein
MKMLFVDFETQSDEPSNTNITEIGAALVEMEARENEPPVFHFRDQLETLVYDPAYPPQTDEIVELTGITDARLKAEGILPAVALSKLSPMVAQADVAIAHNKGFDQVVYESSSKRVGLAPVTPPRGWLCTVSEVPYAKKYKCKKLSHLAFDHGMLVDQSQLHRALYDVRLLAYLVTLHYNIHELLAYRDEPWVYLQIQIPPPWIGRGGDGGIGKAHAVKLGYSWEKARGTETPVFSKCWVKRVKAKAVETEKALAQYPVVVLGE